MATAHLVFLPSATCSSGQDTTHCDQVTSKTRNESKPPSYSLSNHPWKLQGKLVGLNLSSSPAWPWPTFHSFRSDHGLLIYSSQETNNPKNDHHQLQEEALPTQLAVEKNWDGNGNLLYSYKGVWYPAYVISAVFSFQQHFVAEDTDIIIASMPKSGTTWLKALTFSVVNRDRYSPKESPLLSTPPHELVRFFETDLYLGNHLPDLKQIPSPRIFGCHTHYASLPQCIRDSNCKVVYICRNPLDQVVSYYHFAHKFKREINAATQPAISSIDEGFENICQGLQSFGPFWDSALGYWKASLERPDKVLFLKYEDLKEDININLKRLAQFLGLPFTENEENEGVIEEISRLCSFDALRSLEVNKKGVRPYSGAPNSSFFRKGEVGDWVNHITPAMAERFRKIVEDKLAGSGLAFKMSRLE